MKRPTRICVLIFLAMLSSVLARASSGEERAPRPDKIRARAGGESSLSGAILSDGTVTELRSKCCDGKTIPIGSGGRPESRINWMAGFPELSKVTPNGGGDDIVLTYRDGNVLTCQYKSEKIACADKKRDPSSPLIRAARRLPQIGRRNSFAITTSSRCGGTRWLSTTIRCRPAKTSRPSTKTTKISN